MQRVSLIHFLIMINKNSLSTSDKNAVFSGKIRFLIFLFLVVFLAGLLYRGPISALYDAVLDRQDSSHGLFVPLISAYFLWIRFNRIKEINFDSAILPGLALLGISLGLLFLSSIAGFQLAILSFLFLIGALILILFGKELFVETAFPLFFLATMIPLPTDMFYSIAEMMRAVNTWGSVKITAALGVPLYRDGYNIYIPGLHLFVDYGCSGIRYLLSFFTFSIVYAFLFKKSPLTRVVFVLCSIPFSFLAGIVRLSVVFLAAHYISPFWAQHTPHVFLSWVVFAVFLIGVIGIDQYVVRRNEK